MDSTRNDTRYRVICALAALTDFDYETELFKQAGNLEAAMDICTSNLLKSLKSLNNITYRLAKGSIIYLRSKEEVEDNIKDFIKRFDIKLDSFIAQFVKINKIYPCSLKEKNQIFDNMKKYANDISNELDLINNKALMLTKWAKEYDLHLEAEYITTLQQLENISYLDSTKFFALLKHIFSKDIRIDNGIFRKILKTMR